MASIPTSKGMRPYLVKAIDQDGLRWTYTQLARSAAAAEQIALKRIGLPRYLFVRRHS
jgi:hypothetical protein